MELLVVLAIVSILAGLSVPSFRAMLVNSARREASTGLYAALSRARSEAIVRSRTISVCPRDIAQTTPSCQSGSDWSQGWIVYDARPPITILLVHDPLRFDFTFQNAPATVDFASSGRASGTLSFTLCHEAGDSQSRTLNVNRSGRISLVEGGTCS